MSLLKLLGTALGAVLVREWLREPLAVAGETLAQTCAAAREEVEGAKGGSAATAKTPARKPAPKPPPRPTAPAKTTAAGVTTPAERRRLAALREQRLVNLAKGRETRARHLRAKKRAAKATP